MTDFWLIECGQLHSHAFQREYVLPFLFYLPLGWKGTQWGTLWTVGMRRTSYGWHSKKAKSLDSSWLYGVEPQYQLGL